MKTTSAQLIFQYWDKLRGDRAAPERGEIEPGAVRHALLDTFILEAEGESLVFRLAGTRVCALFGQELKGKPLLPLFADPATRIEMARMTEAVMDESAGALAGLAARTLDGDMLDLELLVLPLRHNGRTHARVLGSLGPNLPPAWLGAKPVVDATVRSMRIIWPSGQPTATITPEIRRSKFTVVRGGRN